MIRKETDRAGGRRPLVLHGNNRQMLNEIRDSLSHLRRQNVDGDQLKPELSQSTQSLPDKALISSGSKMKSRDNQHRKALAEIRDSLRPFQTGGQGGVLGGVNSGACSSDNSSTTSSTVSEQDNTHAMVQAIVSCGFDEDIAMQALKLSGNQSVDAALKLLRYIMEEKLGKPGFPPPNSLTLKPMGPSSPAPSETNSVRSDSPGPSTFAPPPRQLMLVNGQQPPPLPPRVPITTAAGAPGLVPSSGAPSQQGAVLTSHPVGAYTVPQSHAHPGHSVEVGMVAGKQAAVAKPGYLQTVSKGSGPGQAAMLAQNSQVVAPGHVQQLVQRMSPSPALHLHHKQQQQQHHHQSQQQQQQYCLDV